MTARGAVVVMAAGCSAGVTSTEEAGVPGQVQGTSAVVPPVSPAPSPSPTGPVGVLPISGEVGKVDKGQLPPVISSISTSRKVVFLTIDDGWEQDPGFARRVREKRVPITVFATRDAVEAKGPIDRSAENGRFLGAGGWPYFKELGVPVENHTLSHPNLRTLGYDGQKAEICGASTVIKRQVGVRPTLFRPPFGNYNSETLRAAKACGIRAVLLWSASVQPGGKIAYQTPDKKLRPGDILLLHFRPNLSRDFRVLLNKIHRRGFELGNLEAYLAAAMR